MMNLFSKPGSPGVMRLSTGCFTVDPAGEIVASTLPQNFPAAPMQAMAQQFLAAFRGAQAAQLPLTELMIHYSALTLTARELHGGVIVYLTTRALGQH